MAGLFTFRGTGVHEDFAKTRAVKKPSHTRDSPKDKFVYNFDAVAESKLSASQTTLCEHCSVLQLTNVRLAYTGNPNGRKPLELKADVPGFEEDLAYNRKDVVPLLPGLAESADAGCGFCALLRNAILWHFRQYSVERLPDDTMEITRIRHYWNPGLTAFTVHSTAFVCRGHRFGYLTFKVNANRTDRCASVFDISSERIPNSVISPAGIFTMKQWVFGNKKQRAALKALHRPTRLIHIGSRRESGLIRLVDSHAHAEMNDTSPPYLALSYCWGGKAPSLITTKSNYAHLQTSISYSALPKTYQDTVRVARALSIRYIWIDALCIIQDDVADWEHESQMMAEIFRNSLVTVIPLCAASSNDGFLERNPSIKVNYHSSEWNINGSYFIRHMPFSYVNAESAIRAAPSFSDRPVSLELHSSHWQTRGWTFQEDMFAMRKLYFGHLMMYWDSLKPVDIMRTEDKIIDDKLDHMDTAELSIIHSSGPWRGDYDYDGWYYPILKYSQKRLTYETDRLPAVSSYAKLIARKSGDVYLAGLWKNNLHRGLLWKIQRRQRGTLSELIDSLARPPEFIAPSWSWASRRGSLLLDGSDNMQSECDVLEAKTRVYGEDMYGRVRGGYLVIRGKVCSIPGGRLQKLPLGSPYLEVQCEWLALDDDGQYVAQCALDWRETDDRGRQFAETRGDHIQSIVMLLVSSGNTKSASGYSNRPQDWADNDEGPPREVMHGLLLYPTGNSNDEYWRVGLFHSLSDGKGGRKYFDECKERTLRIV